MPITAPLSTLPFYWWYTSVHESTQQLPLTLRQCSAITFLTGGNNESSIQPTPPYTLFVYPSDDIPRVIAGGMDGSAARWRVDYPVGTQLLLAFADSKGNPGGTSALTTVINGQSNDCVSPSNTTLSLGYTPAAPSTCQSVSLLPSGGVPPYAVTIQKAGDQGINITEVSNTTSWTNDLQAGGSIIYALSDSTGAYAATSSVIFSAGGANNDCLSNRADDGNTPGQRPSGLASPEHKTSKGLIGGIIGACLISMALLGLIAWLLFKKRRQQEEASSASSKRLSFTHNGHRDTLASTIPFASMEKNNGPGHSPLLDTASVHSLQNLHPYKFRIVNPDLDQDASRAEDDDDRPPDSPSINSHSDMRGYSSPSLSYAPSPIIASEAYAQSSAHAHLRSGSGESTATRRRSGSLKQSVSDSTINSLGKRQSGPYGGLSGEQASPRFRDSKRVSRSSIGDLPDYSTSYR